MDVVLRGLSKRFGAEPILSDVDLELNAGQNVAVIGLNGAGKTTLLRCLAGAIAPSAGSIRWNECDSIRDDVAVHRQMMFLPDTPLLIETQSVIDNIVVMLRAYGREAAVSDAEVIALLKELDLLEHCSSPAGRLSRGQRYKTALAALVLIKPELWLLDEPFASGMDPQGMHSLRQHARKAVAAGACLVYSTQIIEIAERFCDVLLVIDRGRLAQRFAGDELRAMPTEGPGSLSERLAAFRERS
jgi:ABC-type multidrug transport system ATPase subunit